MLTLSPKITLVGDVEGEGTSTVQTNLATVMWSSLQNMSNGDRLLGRQSSGTGVIEEITCTSAGRALLDDDAASSQRATLGLGTMSEQNSNSVNITGGTISGVTLSGQTIFYQNQNIKTSVKIWSGSATTSGGVATFYPTSDNTGSGTALLTNIYSAIPSASCNLSTAVDIPSPSVKLIASDKKSVTVNAVIGRTLIALGATQAFAPDGTIVYLTIIGD